YWNGIFPISVPCDSTSYTNHGTTPYTASVRMVQRVPDAADVDAMANALAAAGGRADVVQSARNAQWSSSTAPVPDGSGGCQFLAYVPRVPSHGSVALNLEIIPPTPPGVHQRGSLGTIKTSIYGNGTHGDPDAPDSALRAFLRELGLNVDSWVP